MKNQALQTIQLNSIGEQHGKRKPTSTTPKHWCCFLFFFNVPVVDTFLKLVIQSQLLLTGTLTLDSITQLQLIRTMSVCIRLTFANSPSLQGGLFSTITPSTKSTRWNKVVVLLGSETTTGQ